jgi:hypothetical protein
MKYINNYLTKASYTADSNRPTTKSTVSNVADGTGILYEGKNVLVDKAGAGIGDIAVYNTSVSAVQFIKFGTYNAATLPASITILGVVYYRTENRVNIVSKNNQASARWAEGYKVKLSGFDLVNGGAFTITVNSTITAAITYTNTDTLTTIAAAISTALTNAGFTSATGWAATADNANNCISIVRNWYTPVINTFTIADAASKVVATIITTKDYQCTLSGLLTAYSNITRVDGSVSSYAGANYPKFYSYYYASGGTNTNEPLKSGNVVKFAVFNSTDNPTLTSYYGSGEAGYTAYIKDKMLRYPFSKGSIIDDNGQNNTNLLAPVMYTDIDGISKPAYPAAYNSKQFGIVVNGYTTGFEVGNWWLPSVREMYLLIKDVLLDNSDIVNKTLTAISGDKVLASGYYPWTSTESNANYSWFYYGTYGNLGNFSKFGTYGVRSVTAF